MTTFKSFAAASVAISMAATPAVAADLPTIGQGNDYAAPAYDYEQDSSEHHRRWRGYRRNRVSAGDVIAGIAIIGGIAAIASAANKNTRRDRYDDRRYRDRDYQRRYRSNNLDRAVSACTSEIGRDVRVDSVDNVSRAGDGWQVSGRLYDGNGFTCSVGANGRVSNIDYSGNFSGASSSYDGQTTADSQWSDDRYAQARQAQAGQYTPQSAPLSAPQGQQPAYPGGPLPGDEIDGDLGG